MCNFSMNLKDFCVKKLENFSSSISQHQKILLFVKDLINPSAILVVCLTRCGLKYLVSTFLKNILMPSKVITKINFQLNIRDLQLAGKQRYKSIKIISYTNCLLYMQNCLFCFKSSGKLILLCE